MTYTQGTGVEYSMPRRSVEERNGIAERRARLAGFFLVAALVAAGCTLVFAAADVVMAEQLWHLWTTGLIATVGFGVIFYLVARSSAYVAD